MPTIQPASRYDNIEKSLNAYTVAGIVDDLGIPVYFLGQDRVGQDPPTWVESSVVYGGQVSVIDHGPAHTIGAWEEVYLNLNVFVLDHSGLQPIGIYELATVATNIKQFYDVPVAIPVRDYDEVGTPIVGNLTVREKARVQRIPTASDSGVEQMNISVLMRYHAFTAFA